MDFVNPKVYGDIYISDGLVYGIPEDELNPPWIQSNFTE